MVFTYHRVPQDKDPFTPEEPSAAEFAQQIGVMAEYLNVIRLEDVPAMMRAGDLPARAACITFDDGYENNLSVAAPLLKQHGLPATVFVAVDPVRTGFMWNDLVIETLRHCGDELDLSDEGLGVLRFSSEEERIAAIPTLLGELKYREPAQRQREAIAIYQRVVSPELPRLMLRPEQLPELAGYGVSIGAHTMTHPILTNVNDSTARREIEDSRNWLGEHCDVTPTTFAYPNGRPGIDFNKAHADMVADAGFTSAVTTTWGCATMQSSMYELPRFTPWETDQAGFLRRLEKTLIKSYLPG